MAPFWGVADHVGHYRVDRFVRWLSSSGIQVVLVNAGTADGLQATPWGAQVTLRDPLALHGRALPRRPNRLRRLAAYLLLSPDPSILWARRVVTNPTVLQQGRGVDYVLSSSPPESAHVASFLLARRMGARLIIDMRDGWLDEPNKPLLRTSRLQRWREGRLENRILRQAARIFVTSPVWRTLLEDRLPFTVGKTTILTNACPSCPPPAAATEPRPSNEPLLLIHAGRFSGSRSTQRLGSLLQPILRGIRPSQPRGLIVLLGSLEAADLNELPPWRTACHSLGWSLEVRPPVPRAELPHHLRGASGLLLLSASSAPIPSKLFEYLPTGRPILCVTPRRSAVWTIASDLPQAYCLDCFDPTDAEAVLAEYLRACATQEQRFGVPSRFSEDALSQVFLDALGVRAARGSHAGT